MLKLVIFVLILSLMPISCSQENSSSDVKSVNSPSGNEVDFNTIGLSDSLATHALIENICALAEQCAVLRSKTIDGTEYVRKVVYLQGNISNGYISYDCSPLFCEENLIERFWFDTTKTREMINQCAEALNITGTQCVENDSLGIERGEGERYTLLPSPCAELFVCNSGPCND